MNGNNYRNSHHRSTQQYLIGEQQQQQFNVSGKSQQHLRADQALASSRPSAIYNGLPMPLHHNIQNQHQHHSNMGFHQQTTSNNGNLRTNKGPAASDYCMPPMAPISSASSSKSPSINQLTDQLNKTHLTSNNDSHHQQNSHQNFYQNQYARQTNAKSYDKSLGTDEEYEQEQQYSANSQFQQEQDNERLSIEYANQLRQSQFKHKYQQNDMNQYYPIKQQQHQHQATSSNSNHHHYNSHHTHQNNSNNNHVYQQSQQLHNYIDHDNNHNRKQYQQQNNNQNVNTSESSAAKSTMHVNFNRCARPGKSGTNDAIDVNCDDDSESPGRKKKYLTAKYGQQQMNLIKKRLKVEMWLYEQLKELAKGTKSEDELDEIDIDLDQILDMENDDARQNWLKKLLQPYDDLPKDRVDKFICDVIEQSRLL